MPLCQAASLVAGVALIRLVAVMVAVAVLEALLCVMIDSTPTTTVVLVVGDLGVLGPRRTALQVDVDPTGVVFGGVVQPHLATESLDLGLQPLHVVLAVVSHADDHVQVGLARGLGVPDPPLEDVLGLFDVLAVQVDGVAGHALEPVVLAEDELARAPVVPLHQRAVLPALFRQRLGRGPVAALVGRARPLQARLPLRPFSTCQPPEPVVLGLGRGGLAVVERCDW